MPDTTNDVSIPFTISKAYTEDEEENTSDKGSSAPASPEHPQKELRVIADGSLNGSDVGTMSSGETSNSSPGSGVSHPNETESSELVRDFEKTFEKTAESLQAGVKHDIDSTASKYAVSDKLTLSDGQTEAVSHS